MAVFKYEAKDGPTKIVTGSVTARDKTEAVMKLADQGITPLSVHEVTDKGHSLKKKGIFKSRGVSLNDLHLVTFQLEELIASGLTLHTALGSVSSHTEHPVLATVFYELEKRVTEGKSLSESLQTFPHIFSPFYVNMVRSGEESGNLAEVLSQLAEVYEKEHDLKTRVQQALAYPALIAFAGLGTVAVILIFVIPRLESMYADLGKGLPFITTVVIALSTFLQHFWWGILFLIIVALWYARQIKYNHAREGRIIDFLIARVPVWGALVLKEEISRFVRSVALLFTSGISILDALSVSKNILRSEKIKKEIDCAHEKVRNGLALSEALRDAQSFSPFIINMIATGERTGKMDRSFKRITILYDKEIDSLLKVITTLIEPLLVLLIGSVVGVIVISMLLPIFQINVFMQ
jgi:type II secretory pathway component PulF